MPKIIPISEYERMSDAALIAEVQQRRREVQRPRLNGRDHFSNFLISAGASGSFFASAFGFGYNLMHSDKIGSFNNNLREYINVLRDKEKSGKDFLKDKQEFRNLLLYSTAVFVVSSLLTVPIVSYFQKQERSEDNATMHLFGKDELARRGYFQQPEGDFVKRIQSQRMKQEEVECQQFS